jgi:hypothetical protein
MIDPERRFGPIRVVRKRENIGKPFVVGERFQGLYSLKTPLRLAEQRGVLGGMRKIANTIMSSSEVTTLLRTIEDQFTSDYGVISEIDLTGTDGPRRVAYRYLEGSPMAGSSTFVVEERAPCVSVLTQAFEYQELNAASIFFFATAGLRIHYQVVFSQVAQAASLLGAKILETDIPSAYLRD